jgi:hypothetical protein
LWNARPENRHLPAWWEWLNMRLLTRKKAWTPSQKKMMRQATRYHAVRGVALLLALLLLGWAGYEGYGWMQAEKLVESIVRTETGDVPRLVEQLPPYRRWADTRLLRHTQAAPDHSKEHLHASLALVPVDDGQVDYLYRRLLGAGPTEMVVIRDALAEHREALAGRLWGVLGDAQADPEERFRAACALATYDDGNRERWAGESMFVADRLLVAVQQNPSHYTALVEMLRPVRDSLIGPLSKAYGNREGGGQIGPGRPRSWPNTPPMRATWGHWPTSSWTATRSSSPCCTRSSRPTASGRRRCWPRR